MQAEKWKLLQHSLVCGKVGVIKKMLFCILKLKKCFFFAISGGPSSLDVSVFPFSGMTRANMLLLLSA